MAFVVDDNAHYLAACSRLLRRRGFLPLAFCRYNDAVRGLGEIGDGEGPEVILIDVVLDAGHSGLELHERIVRDYKNRAAIALMSAYRLATHPVIRKTDPSELERFLTYAAVLNVTAFHSAISDSLVDFVHHHHLSPQEARIVSHLYVGSTRASLAKRLGLSENTVKSQIRQLLRRLDLEAVDELIAFLLRFLYVRARGRS